MLLVPFLPRNKPMYPRLSTVLSHVKVNLLFKSGDDIDIHIYVYFFKQIDGINVFALSTIGYLAYSFAQIFMFCIHGNELIEEVIFR